MLLELVCLGLGVRNHSCVTPGGPTSSLGFSFLILSLDGQGKSYNQHHDHKKAQSGSGSGEGVTGLGDPGLEGWSVQQRLLTMAWFGVFVPFLEEQM